MAGRRRLLGLSLALAAMVTGIGVWSTRDRAAAPELFPAVASGESAHGHPGEANLEPPSGDASSGPDAAAASGARRAAGAPRVEGRRPEPKRGRVVEARTGLGIADVEVVWREGERTSRATSDVEGHFELELAPGAGASLAVRHPRFVDAARPLTELPEGELVLALARSATLEVRVDGAWDPQTRPEVRVVRVGGSEEEGLSAALTGRLAVFEDLAPGDVHVAVVPAQGPIVRREYVPLESGETTRIGVDLEPGATLAGTVQLQGSCAPRAGASVTLFSNTTSPVGAEDDPIRVTTGSDGSFLLESLPSEFFGALVVEAPWGSRVQQGVAAGAKPVRIRFPAPAHLSGVVREESGAGAAGCVVACRLHGAEAALHEVEADAAGRFDLGQVPGGAKLEVTAARGASWARVTARVPHGGIRSDLELVLAEDLALHGRIVRRDDESPIAGATVRVTSGPRAEREATAGADGSFVLRLPRSASVAVSAPGFRTRTLRVHAVEKAEGFVVALEPATPLAGWVVDGDGWGVPGAHVRARKGKDKRETVADARGAFEFDALTPGRWTFEAWAARGDRSAPETIEVVEGVPLEPLRLELEFLASSATGTVAGEIVLAGSGDPVPGLTFPKGGRVALDGTRFVLYGQAASDRYRLWARGEGVEEIWLSGLMLTPGARVEVGRLETRPTSRVRVRLAGASIQRDEARVVLRRAEAPKFPWLRVPREIELEWNAGAWEADGVGRYAWTLLVREDGDLRHRERVEVRSRREELTVRIE